MAAGVVISVCQFTVVQTVISATIGKIAIKFNSDAHVHRDEQFKLWLALNSICPKLWFYYHTLNLDGEHGKHLRLPAQLASSL